ncbi:GNAT family N-acetyltransferase [Polymorphobacter sp.]|uniref:GNAT family N-acetyltransferase n=1 Tax=Polymorphobacter sp. TaxID=1909290 RepID=UPI003F70B02B
MQIRVLKAERRAELFPQLSAIVREAIEDGASTCFLETCTADDMDRFWHAQSDAVAAGRLAVLAAVEGGEIIGTVSIGLETTPNQAHRATVTMLIVRRDHQQHGVGAALLAMAEAEATKRGRWLLTCEMVSGSTAARLFERAGWDKIGDVPAMSMMPHGGLAPGSLYFKRL